MPRKLPNKLPNTFLKTSQSWPATRKFPYMGRLPIYGKTYHVWEELPYLGRLPRLINNAFFPNQKNTQSDVGVT
jgi:hypothetical protein